MALSDCLNNYVGIEGTCSDTVSESGLYVNTLPGISLKMLANVADEETKDFTGVWNEIYSRTLSEIEADVLVRSQKFFKTNLIVDNTNTGYYADPLATVSASAELKGNTIELSFNTSRYLSIFVNSVQIYLPVASLSTDIFIYNLMNGELLDTINFAGGIGINTVQINKAYKTYGQDTKIFICYDATAQASVEVATIDSSQLAITRGAKISTATTPILLDSLTLGGEGYGLIANYNIRCDISEFICSNKDTFKFALWYKLGASLMFERLLSTRLNKYTIEQTPLRIKELKEEYEDLYGKQMDAIMDNLEASSDQVCFSCRKERNYKYNRP